MTKLTDTQKKVYDYIKKKQGISHSDLTKQIGMPSVHLANSLKALTAAKLVTMEMKGDAQHYTAANELPKAEEKTTETKPAGKAVGKEKIADKKVAPKGGKNFDTFKFNGKEYRKGRLPHAMIAKFCEDHQPTLPQLEAAYPTKEIKPYGYGLFRNATDAKKINEQSGRVRFFTKPEELVKIKGGTIAVTNQITSELLERFLVVAKRHKLVVK